MSLERRGQWRWAAMACLALACAIGLARVASRYAAARAPTGSLRLETPDGAFAYRPRDGSLTLQPAAGGAAREGTLVVVYRGARMPLVLRRVEAASLRAVRGDVALSAGAVALDAGVALEVDPSTGGLVVSLAVRDATPPVDAGSGPELAFETAARDAFASGVGVIGDAASVQAPFVQFGDAPSLAVAAEMLQITSEMSPRGLAVRAGSRAGTLVLFAAGDEAASVGHVYARTGLPVLRVAGVVRGVAGRARVTALDDGGAPSVRFVTSPDGRFDVSVPASVTRWYAGPLTTGTATSAPQMFAPGSGFELALDVSAGGELEVSVLDADGHLPLTARLIVHGVDGTLDPTFGPDFRASGAGPLIDALRGSVTTPVPRGRYRVAATKGLEWSIDAKVVDVAAGERVRVDLSPRHVVPTPGIVGSDLHVHARPSFDSPVSVEDRVLSLVAAGVDFAVPTEHNIVGDYAPALEVSGLASELAHVRGVELTTYSPSFGHFGLFPWPPDRPIPPFRGSSVGKLVTAARVGDPDRVLQINHPRLPNQIGYFELSGFRAGGPVPSGLRTDFDAIEVYNGYDLATPSRVAAVMGDWFALLQAGRHLVGTGSSDSHRIQYQWAGYPRTMIAVGARGGGDDGAAIDPLLVVAALKKGQATVTSGPMIDVVLQGARPGGAARRGRGPLKGHLVVRAAPWVDVTSVEIVVGGVVAQTLAVASRPTTVGPETGSLDEARARTVRLDAPLAVDVPAGASWVIVIAKGTRLLDDVLPFMPVAPLAFSNPIWVND